MNVFEAIKDNVTTRQAAEMYGIRVNRHGMAVCPFHNDRNPSMKVDMRFHCFACQADGDAVDFVSRLFGLPSKEAAMKLADDFGICYDSRQKPSVRPKIREPTPEQRYQQEENRCYKVLTDYFHSLRAWKQHVRGLTDLCTDAVAALLRNGARCALHFSKCCHGVVGRACVQLADTDDDWLGR